MNFRLLAADALCTFGNKLLTNHLTSWYGINMLFVLNSWNNSEIEIFHSIIINLFARFIYLQIIYQIRRHAWKKSFWNVIDTFSTRDIAADDLAPGIHQAICIHGTEICCHCFEISKRDHNWLNTLLVEKLNTIKPKRVILHVSYLKCRFMHFPNKADIIFWDRHWLSNLPRSSAIPRRYMLDSRSGSCTNLFVTVALRTKTLWSVTVYSLTAWYTDGPCDNIHCHQRTQLECGAGCYTK